MIILAIFLGILGFGVILTVLSCCKMASDADRWDEENQRELMEREEFSKADES